MILFLFCEAFSVQAVASAAKYSNEWIFDWDADGQPLSGTINSGTNSPPAQFAAGSGSTVFTTNRALLCIGKDDGSEGVWTNGAVLDAALSATSGVHYLRYDVAYNLSSTSNNSGTVLGVYFTGNSGDKVAGVVLGYNTGNLPSSLPAGRMLTPVPGATNLAKNGSFTAIAEVNLGSNTLKVWYGLNGSTPTNYSAHAASTNISLTSITNLRFHATGDFRPAGSTDYAAVDNIRHAATWADIVEPIPDFSAGPAIQIVSVTVTNPSGTAGTDIGETNTVKVVIRNLSAPATNLISAVSAATNAAYFTITSNNTPVVLTYPQYTTNTFSLMANTNALNGTYIFNVDVTADGGVHTNATFSLTVGSQISYLTHSIVEVTNLYLFGGVTNGRYEPGETIDITVISTNNGANAVSNIVNSLSADPAYFTISNLTSTVYPSMSVGSSTSTLYRVTIDSATPHGTNWFSVTNQAGAKIWTNSFPVSIFRQGIPAVSPASITINVTEGTVATNTEVTVTNSGNAALTFSITDNGTWDSVYTAATGSQGISGFVAAYDAITLNDPDPDSPYIEAQNAGVSSARSIGFSFPFYGTTYSNFYVTADGYIGLINTTNTPTQSKDRQTLPAANMDPFIAPFWGTLTSPTGSIRMIRSENNYLIISCVGVSKESGGTNLQFQTALYTDGRIEFRYKNIAGVTNTYGLTNVTIGIQGSTNSYTNLTVTPVNGTSIRLSSQPDQWVSYSPSQNVTVAPQSSQTITFIADASGKTAGASTTFNAWFNWSTGGSNSVAVTANVTAPPATAPGYSAVSSLSFTGAAGQATSVPFIITNTGTASLDFSIYSDDVINTNVLYTTNTAYYSWIDISSIGTDIDLIDPDPASPYISAADEGFSAMIPIGFVFPFIGRSYTQFVASVNGALRLDTSARLQARGPGALGLLSSSILPAQLIAPYWGELAMDANATLKYHSTTERLVVTWENIRQYGPGGGSNLTFQVILKPNGNIVFQYKHLEGAPWPTTDIGFRDLFNSTIYYWYEGYEGQNYIRLPSDRTVWTNQYGTVFTQYVNAVSNRILALLPKELPVIGFSPSSGTVPAGGTAEITITGNASDQSIGTNSIVTNATLTIVHNATGSPDTLDVTFTATNSLQTGFVRTLDDSDGDGLADDAERIAGTDLRDAGSVFATKVTHTGDGALLSWDAPLDGQSRTNKVYFTTNLMSSWTLLYTITNGTDYLDTVHSNTPVIYYKVTTE